jgi:hypothetical protein
LKEEEAMIFSDKKMISNALVSLAQLGNYQNFESK